MRRLTPLAAVLVACLLAVPQLPAPAAAGTVLLKAQQRLSTLRCNGGPADGTMDIRTRSAIIRFQSRHGLAQSGELNSATRTLLHSDRARRCDLRKVPRSGSGRRIVVSQGQNWVWLVRSDGSIAAQGGVVDNPRVLRKGTYRTGSYCGRPARVRLNRSATAPLWLDHFVRFAPCGIGFHRIPRQMSTGRQIHADFYLGTNLAGDSAGCIRLSRGMAIRIWDFTAGRRTTIKVV